WLQFAYQPGIALPRGDSRHQEASLTLHGTICCIYVPLIYSAEPYNLRNVSATEDTDISPVAAPTVRSASSGESNTCTPLRRRNNSALFIAVRLLASLNICPLAVATK